MNKNEKSNIIIQALLSKIISDEWNELNQKELYHLCQYVNYEKIPDRTIADNELLHAMIPWENLDRMKLVRIVARNLKVADFIDLSSYNYKIKEVKNMLKIRPNLLDKLKIDLESIEHEDAFSLLTIGAEEISNKIDIKKYDFTAKEIYEIIEFNNFYDRIVREFSLIKLKDYHICNIIINTGDEFFDILDLRKLTARKWLDILQVRPLLFDYCDLEKFKQSDIYNSVELICLFPYENLDFLIKDRNYVDELSALGWEKLIIVKPNEFIDICCYWKFNETNWKNITNYHPQLIVYKT
jgi:hypothetical protein